MSSIFSTPSFHNLNSLIKASDFKTAGNFTMKYSKTLTLMVFFICDLFSKICKISGSISNLLKSSKGRDKLCGVLQYLAEFYAVCVKNSSIPEIRNLFL